MKRLYVGLMALLLAVSVLAVWAYLALAGEVKPPSLRTGSSQAMKWQGYLADRQCADSVREDNDPKDFLRHHMKDCALMPNCRAKGYELYSGHRWLTLDKHGNELAVGALKGSKRKSGLYVEVLGSRKGDALMVQGIREIEEPRLNEGGE